MYTFLATMQLYEPLWEREIRRLEGSITEEYYPREANIILSSRNLIVRVREIGVLLYPRRICDQISKHLTSDHQKLKVFHSSRFSPRYEIIFPWENCSTYLSFNWDTDM